MVHFQDGRKKAIQESGHCRVWWIIGPRERIVLLGHPNSGAPALLDIIGRTDRSDIRMGRRRAAAVGFRAAFCDMEGSTRRANSSRDYPGSIRWTRRKILTVAAAGLGRSDILDLPPRATPGVGRPSSAST